MFSSLETGLGLDFVLALQSMQNDFFDLLARVLDFAGSDLFYMIILALIYWSLNRKLGTRMLFALILSGLLNVVLKSLFQGARPYLASNEVRLLVEEQNDFGIPSGHVMNATVVWGYLAWSLRRRWVTIGVIVYVLLMGWARMYGGVHFPQDVIGGVLIGLIVLWGFIRIEQNFPTLWDRVEMPVRVAMLVLAAIVATTFVWPDENGVSLSGVLIGVGLGAVLQKALHFQFDNAQPTAQRVICFAAGIVLLLALFFGLRAIFNAVADEPSTAATVLRIVRYGVVGLLAYALYPLIAARFKLVESTSA